MSEGRSSDQRDTVNPVRWGRAADVFHAALDVAPEARDGFLRSACDGDSRLREEVAALLVSDGKAGDFIERPAAALLGGERFVPRLSRGVVLGRYEIVDFLGAGGVSEVYRARDTRLGRAVALKLVTNPADSDAGSRLLAEAQHASILNHPNICGVHEAEHDAAMPFIVLELVEGPTLSEVLRTRRPTLHEVMAWAKDVASALDHAHRAGVVHRDLKSANVALSRDGTIKVLDFGLSRRVQRTEAGQSPSAILENASVAGTLTHIAPEVLRGKTVDHRVDLWALGVLLYEMTSGVLPFKRSSPLETATAILDAAPAPLPTSVPLPLRQVIDRCLAKDPAQRFSTAAEVRTALEEIRVDDHPRRHLRWAAAAVALTVLVVLLWVAGIPRGASPAATHTLAVLPFENSSGDPAHAYFADGVTEELAAALGRVDGLRVVAATSSLRRRNEGKPVAEIARAAGVDRLLDGSVARTGNQITLKVRLLDALTAEVLWSDEYTRDAREVLTLYATIANAVPEAARVVLNAEDTRHFASVRAVDPDVYEAYLKGRYYWNQRTANTLRAAVSSFETAIQLDPTYAPAYAALADCYNLLGTVMVAGGSPREWRPKAREAAIKALQLDPDLGEAHATLGYVSHYDWQWSEAEKSLRRAIALNPSNALARIWYANLLSSLRRLEEATAQALIARELDPLSMIVATNVGWVHHRAGRHLDAIAEYQRALRLEPAYLQAHMRLADSYVELRRFDEAVATAETVVRLSNQNPVEKVALERTKFLAGRPNDFERQLNAVLADSSTYVSPGMIANAYLAVGRTDDAFAWLERAYEERSNNMAYLAVEPHYAPVRDDPRFQQLLRKVGLQ
jgi:TolB-like protein/Tfp pilus assembly protein PilF